MASIRSVFVGQPKVMHDARGEWTSSIARDPVTGSIEVTRRGLLGDRVTQPFHGSLDAAICCQPADHYRFWKDAYGVELTDGAVGENFTLEDVTDSEICAGDIVLVGSALLQVTGPRVPCNTLARRIGRADWVKLTTRENRSGLYARVLEPGAVQAGDCWKLQDRPHPRAAITAINRCYFLHFDGDFGRSLVEMNELGSWWRERLLKKLQESERSGEQLMLGLRD
jgi:MOSC domain-containing protein YiiM